MKKKSVTAAVCRCRRHPQLHQGEDYYATVGLQFYLELDLKLFPELLWEIVLMRHCLNRHGEITAPGEINTGLKKRQAKKVYSLPPLPD